MELGGHVVTVPGPLWTEAAKPVELEKSQVVYRQVDEAVESVLFLPVNETLVTWTRLMGVLVVNRPGYLGSYHTTSMIEPMQQNCATDQLGVSSVPAMQPGTGEALLLLCGRYRPTANGVNRCAAGVVLAVVRESKWGAMKVYHEWCTPSFDVRDGKAWPVSSLELRRRASDLQQATAFTPLPSRSGTALPPGDSP